MIYTLGEVRAAAKRFLAVADKYNEQVSAFLDGSCKDEDVEAYEKVINSNRYFLITYCDYYGEPMMQPHLDYELAESVLPRIKPEYLR